MANDFAAVMHHQSTLKCLLIRPTRYACVGYSVYLDNKDVHTTGDQKSRAELPVCVGLEVTVVALHVAAVSASVSVLNLNVLLCIMSYLQRGSSLLRKDGKSRLIMSLRTLQAPLFLLPRFRNRKT